MERRRKYSRHFLRTMQAFPVLLLVSTSLLVIICSLVQYAECVMTFPDESGVYSLFPDEDLKTGRKRFRFDEEPTRSSYRDGRADYSGIVRSYPMLPHDRLHRPVDYSGSRQVYDRDRDSYRDRDNYRDRQSRVYFDDNYRHHRFDPFRQTPRPRPIQTPVSPIIFETTRPLHHHYSDDRFLPPAVGQSKLPIGVATRASGEDIPTRIHVFDPESNSFGNPRNAGGSSSGGGGSSSERTKGPPTNFIETGPPGPDSFLNHEEFLEYQKKIAFSRFRGQDGSENSGGGSGGGASGDASSNNNGKKVLFESKEPYQIDGLLPPDKSGEFLGKVSSTKVPPQQEQRQQHHQQQDIQFIRPSQRDDQRGVSGEGQKFRVSAGSTSNYRPSVEENNNGGGEEGGGEIGSGIGGSSSDGLSEKGEEEESENGKSEVIQPPPTHITKSGRAHNFNSGDSGSASVQSKQITPSISFDDGQVGGTGFRLPKPKTTSTSYSDDEQPNLHGFFPVVPFHLIGAEQTRSSASLERQRQQQQHHIIPHVQHQEQSTTSATTTVKSIPLPTTTRATSTTSASSRDKPIFRTTEVSKIFSSSASSDEGSGSARDDVISIVNKGHPSPTGPILHASAGERSNSETLGKVAITKQQELKRLQKQNSRQLSHGPQLTPTSSYSGFIPDSGLSDSSASSDSADNSNHNNPGTPQSNTNLYFNADTTGKTYLPSELLDTGMITPSSSSPPTSFDITSQSHQDPDHEPDSQHPHNKQHHNTESNKDNMHTLEISKSANIKHSNTSSRAHIHNLHDSDRDTLHSIEVTKHSSVTSGDETIKSTSVDDINNEIDDGDDDDTQQLRTANGIKQGEFHLEGYMISKSGDGGGNNGRRSRSRSSVSRSSDNYPNEEDVDNLQHHRQPYDYPDDFLPRVDMYAPSQSHDISSPLSQLPGTTTPDLQPEHHHDDQSELDLTPPPSSSSTPTHHHHNSTTEDNASHSHDHDAVGDDEDHEDGSDVTGNEYFSRSSEPIITEKNAEEVEQSFSSSSKTGNPLSALVESEPTTLSTEEQNRSTRLSKDNAAKSGNNSSSSILSNLYEGSGVSISNNEPSSISIDLSKAEYVDGDKTNMISNSSGLINTSTGTNVNNNLGEEDDGLASSSKSSEYLDEDGAYEHDEFHKLGKSFRYGSYVNGKRTPVERRVKPKTIDNNLETRLEIINSIVPPSTTSQSSRVEEEVVASLQRELESVPDFDRSFGSVVSKDVSNSLSYPGGGGSADDDDDPSYNTAPLYLESSETLINNTYYLDGINGTLKNGSSNPLTSLNNFIKVTRIRASPPNRPSSSSSASKETVEKTTASILAARRTPKQAIIVSEVAAGTRPKVIGSVVEAGPAWPGLVPSFLRSAKLVSSNRTFTATATVRPRGNSGTNPTHPTSVISSHIQSQQKPTVPVPTQFQLQQIRHHQSVTGRGGGSADDSTRSSISDTSRSVANHANKASNSSSSSSVGSILAKAISTKLLINGSSISNNGTDSSPKAIAITARRLYSSEEDSSSAQRSNSSTGVVSMVHAHISHCPKLHSPTEVICDVHIREGHGIPNPQLTVGWKRKFYNSTQPDVLLALNKAPVSGENGRFDPHHSIMEVEDDQRERLEEFHDKFNVTLAPGISPMLRSVLLIRSVTAPDCGTYQCEVSDGINVLQSETLLFLCH